MGRPRTKPPRKHLLPGPQLVRNIQARLAAQYGIEHGEVNCDPLDFLIMIMKGVLPKELVRATVAGSPEDPKEHPFVPWDLRIDCAKAALPYVRSKILAVDPNAAPPMTPPTAVIDITALMRDPGMRRHLESITSTVVTAQRKAISDGGATLPVTIDTTAVTVEDETIYTPAAGDTTAVPEQDEEI